MLHKKTEYRVQYGKVNTDLRRQIWQDNISSRKSRQLSNQATHYWEYQLRDDESESQTEQEDFEVHPVPSNRQKHNNLIEQYSQKSGKEKSSQPKLVAKDAREMAVQTPEWAGDEPDHRLSDNTSEEELMRNMGTLTIPEAKVSRSRPASPTPPKATPSTSNRSRNARSLSRPSRTCLKLHTENTPSHFLPFGWNEKKISIGTKQTYNISAPQKEVHGSAIQASQKRKAEIERFLAQEKSTKVQPQTRSRDRTCSGSTNQWVSEYKEQYSGKNHSRNSRPLSAPPAAQPVTWRRS